MSRTQKESVKVKIGYKIGASFADWSKEGDIGFEIIFPHVYASFEEAEMKNSRISAKMEKQNDGEVVIVLYEGEVPVETIHWDEWWKYKCNHIKETSKDLGFVDANTDYEPYSERFDKIFEYYCGDKIYETWSMQYLAYWIQPVIIHERKKDEQ